MRILIVEDDLMFIEKSQLFLKKHGYETMVSENVENALILIKQKPVDCVLLDMNLPDMEGTSFIEAVRKKYSKIFRGSN
jgi:DNA-binding response OmpR family regulator